MSSRIPTSMVPDAHAYTRSKSPWIIANSQSTCGRLIHYISGGGIRAFGRTVQQEEASHRQSVALSIIGIISVVWAVFLVF